MARPGLRCLDHLSHHCKHAASTRCFFLVVVALKMDSWCNWGYWNWWSDSLWQVWHTSFCSIGGWELLGKPRKFYQANPWSTLTFWLAEVAVFGSGPLKLPKAKKIQKVETSCCLGLEALLLEKAFAKPGVPNFFFKLEGNLWNNFSGNRGFLWFSVGFFRLNVLRFVGSYEGLIGGSTPWAWQVLTGQPWMARWTREKGAWTSDLPSGQVLKMMKHEWHLCWHIFVVYNLKKTYYMFVVFGCLPGGITTNHFVFIISEAFFCLPAGCCV